MKSLLKYFKYLENEYQMHIIDSYLKGSFPYVIWSNGKINIKIVFDFTDTNPIHIFIYDASDRAMYSYQEFADEFKYYPKSNKDINGYINVASEKFYGILKQNKSILLR